ncbi:hypothetical protein ACWGB8_11895 [Kitasatospora sp. NPDC054939]
MTILLTDAGPVSPRARVDRVGGVPLAPRGTVWPTCTPCGGPLQFLAQFVLDGTVLALFACQNEPGSCEDWSPVAGGNRAFLFPADAPGGLWPIRRPKVPAGARDDVLVRSTVHAAGREVDDTDYAGAEGFDPEWDSVYDRARTAWAARTGRPGKHVLGSLGGSPSWLQYDQTPDCPSCAAPMAFQVQLQEGPDALGAMNFGSGGRGYAFTCPPCSRALFLWQC